MALGNRGPIRFTADGKLDPAILDSYWTHGFYVCRAWSDPRSWPSCAPPSTACWTVRRSSPTPRSIATAGRLPGSRAAALGEGIIKPPYRWAKPLSDPLGGTDKNNGRHPAQMLQPTLGDDAPALIVERLDGNLHLMDACLRLYGHPGLLAVAAAILGDDFVPYNEVTFVKEPGLGPSVAWHQDGMTHWDSPDWDMGAHGFNFMTQLYPSTAGNGVWVLPGTHRERKADIRKMVADAGSDRIPGAVPMLCDAGDTIVTNRQLVHGSFANSSPDRRVTLNAGFFPTPARAGRDGQAAARHCRDLRRATRGRALAPLSAKRVHRRPPAKRFTVRRRAYDEERARRARGRIIQLGIEAAPPDATEERQSARHVYLQVACRHSAAG